MPDRRSLILNRLFLILQGIDGAEFVGRNRNELPENKRPAILLFDGSETRLDESERALPRRHLGAAPSIIRLAPEIWIVLRQSKPHNPTVGNDLNNFRLAILREVLTDVELQSIVGDNGEIRYEASLTDLTRDGEVKGEMGLAIGFLYPLIPNEL